MADPSHSDSLLCFRQSLAANQIPVLTSSDDIADAESNLALATHVHFPLQDGSNQSFLLNSSTRFIAAANDTAVNLRSILWAWQKKDAPISEYFSGTSNLNVELAASAKNADSKVLQLSFVERLALITWLEGATDECENLQPLPNESAAQKAAGAASIAAGTAGGVAVVPSAASAGVAGVKTVDPRLAEIYRHERIMGDRNTVLRGIKPTVRCLLPGPAQIWVEC